MTEHVIDLRVALAMRRWNRAMAIDSPTEAAQAYAALVDAGTPPEELLDMALTIQSMLVDTIGWRAK